jgi:hypothetical protein
MKISKLTFLVPVFLLLSFLVLVFAKQSTRHSIPPHWLAVEVGLTKPMTVVAGTQEHALKAYFRVPNSNQGESPSAIKLESKMVDDKMLVQVTVLAGDLSVVKSCKDWGLLKATRVTSYTMSEGDEVTVSQLPDLGPNFKDGKLSFKAVAALAPQHEIIGEPCCASCGGNTCCPGVGHCMSCPPCGELCC